MSGIQNPKPNPITDVILKSISGVGEIMQGLMKAFALHVIELCSIPGTE